jgi:hypothetical protein
MNIKARNYCFTVNNYSENDLGRFQELAQSLDKHGYICYGLETAPTTGTKHIQGYIQLKSSQRFNFLHKYFGFKKDKKILKFHIESANGTHEDNKKYVKKDGQFFEFGEPVSQGARSDLKRLKESVKEDPKQILKIIDEQANNLQQLKFAQALQSVYLKDRNPNVPPIVYWIFGPTGIGKTSLVYRSFTEVCSVSNYDWLGTGYNQQECFLLDDFRESSLSFDQILKLTDRYPYTVYFKGGQTPFNSPFIIFTSPNSIDSTFTFTRENLGQLKRRILEIDLGAAEDKTGVNLRNLDKKYLYGNLEF